VPQDNTSEVRGTFYNVCGYPDIFFDGSRSMCGASDSPSQMESEYRQAVSNASKVPGNLSIFQNATYHNGVVTEDAEVNSALTGSYNVVTYLVEYIGRQNESNGYGPHDIGWVVRETLINRPVSLISGNTSDVRGTGALNSSWKTMNLSVITFVQQNSSKIVENTNQAPVLNQSARSIVTFTESGLPKQTVWSAELNGSWLSSNGSSVRFNVAAGVYNYTALCNGYITAFSPTNQSSGILAVQGPYTALSVTFRPETFSLIFQESGLPNGTGWGVLIGNQSQTSFTSNLSYSEVDGTYHFIVLPVIGYLASYSGLASINGSDLLVAIPFLPQTYPIVFVEFGLPTGSNWSVTVSNASNGFNETRSSTSNAITFFLPNGTYQINFSLPSGYSGNVSVTNLTVAGTGGPAPVLEALGPPGPVSPSPRASQNSSLASIPAQVWIAFGAVIAIAIALTALLLRRDHPKPPGSEG
jgi:hypothetical protein